MLKNAKQMYISIKRFSVISVQLAKSRNPVKTFLRVANPAPYAYDAPTWLLHSTSVPIAPSVRLQVIVAFDNTT
ncbi:hypothetical protein TcWFU_008535 [Taenia crassiceps]|uniref:Uncharacterized protein n=1 Tax=Taenia crassiceps TaxID=6207 RepID=A0ABR4Q589_9CEST